MNLIIAWLGRRTFAIFMASALCLLIYSFSYGQLPAQAKALTPEAEYYRVEPDYAGKQMFDNAKQKAKDITDNIVEKLNLDEPSPPSTKQFFERVEDQIRNVNGTQEGYSQRESQLKTD
ncbi:MAG TPA: hypothetical protein V6D28_01375 [Leptolyngbyaceae cyanobacterium]